MTNRTKILLLNPLDVVVLFLVAILALLWGPFSFLLFAYLYWKLQFKRNLTCPKCGEKIYPPKIRRLPKRCPFGSFPTDKEYEEEGDYHR